jgi:Predicted membrane protein (DUF2207)
MSIISKMFGRQSENSTIIPMYEPPVDLSAPELGLLFDGKSGRLEFLSAIYQLKVSKIVDISKDSDGTTRLSLLRYPLPDITDYDDMLIRYLFNQQRVVTLNDFFKREDYMILFSYFHYMLLQSLERKNIIKLKDSTVNISYAYYILKLGNNHLLLAKQIMAGLKAIKLTEKGKSLMPELKGFKQYLETAEIEKIKYHATGDLQNYIEKLTPYAIALDMSERWRLINTPIVQVLNSKDTKKTEQVSGDMDYFIRYSEMVKQIDSMQVAGNDLG